MIKSTPALFEPDVELLRGGTVRRVSAWPMVGKVALAAIALPAVGYLFLVSWPFALVLLFLMGVFLVRTPSTRGRWHGHCPFCSAEVWVAAPPLADQHRFNCPSCTRTVMLSDSHFVDETAKAAERQESAVHVRMPPDLVILLDEWMERQTPTPASRPEAIRQIVKSVVTRP